MKNMRRIKRMHNGKDRRTGQKIRKNRNRGGLADPRAEARRQKWVENKAPSTPIEFSRGPCCRDAAAVLAKNEQLLSKLSSMNLEQVYDTNRGAFVPLVPQSFSLDNWDHMPHFRQYLKEKNLSYRFRLKKTTKVSSGPCCKDDAAIKAKNEQLLSELNSIDKAHFQKSVGNTWTSVPIVPKWFKLDNQSHMAHFRQYVKAMNLPYRF